MRASHILGRARDTAAILLHLAAVERERTRLGPEGAVAAARRRGLGARRRASAERGDLRRLIRFVDRRFPGGANCYRRVLLELSIDGGAAREPVQLGLRASGGAGSGHAWLGGGIEIDEPGRRPYDAIVSL